MTNESARNTLNQGIEFAYGYLKDLALNQADFTSTITEAFGNIYDSDKLENLRQNWAVGIFSNIPQIQILPDTILKNADGAFSRATQTIYISDTFLTKKASTPQDSILVLL